MAMGDVPEGTKTPFYDLLEQVRSVAGIPASTRSDAEARFAVSRVVEIRSVLEALSLALIADLDRRPGAIPGAQPDFVARTFLRHSLNRTNAQAKFEVECARRLQPEADPGAGGLPLVGKALTSGQISRDNAVVAVKAMMKLDPDKLGESQPRAAHADLLPASATEPTIPTGSTVDAILAAHARMLDTVQLEKFARALVNAINQDDQDGFDPYAVDRRSVHHSVDPATGMVVGRFQLDAENGAWFAAALQQFTRLDEGREETTTDGVPIAVPPVRAPGQARADALGEICRTALASEQAGSATGSGRPRIVITAGVDTLRDAFLDDAPLHMGAAHGAPAASTKSTSFGPDAAPSAPNTRPARTEHLSAVGRRLLGALACDSILQRAVFAPSGAALSLGREVRTVSKAQRRVLDARDRGCVVPGCSAPARTCQAHHVTWCRDGGPTDVGNLALACSSCHTQIHLGVWSLVMIDGIPWARPPGYVDPQRRLIRNTFHDALDRASNPSQPFRSSPQDELSDRRQP